MEKLRLFGVLCISVIALVSASANSNDPFVSNLLNTVFIISCIVIGVWLLHRTNLSEALILRRKGNRRFNLPVEFSLMDSREVNAFKDRRRVPDRRNENNNFGGQKVMLTKVTSN